MLADVDAGSDTPSLVGKVLKWRKENDAEGIFLISLNIPKGLPNPSLCFRSARAVDIN